MKDILKDFGRFSPNQRLVFFGMFHGIKKSMDIWIPDMFLDNFLEFCDTNKILYKCDVKFLPIQEQKNIKNKVAGGETLTTTKFYGSFLGDNREGSIHIFLSMNPENLNNVFKYGWYPIISDNYVIQKTHQDLQDFGEALGYPHCCRKFFFYKNNWTRYSFLYEIYKQSTSFDYRCNSLWKDNPGGKDYSYMYHMPCTFDCPESIAYAIQIEKKLEKHYPDLLVECKYYLKLPCLVIREQKIYAFEGRLNTEKNELLYTKLFDLSHGGEGNLGEYLKIGNRIQIHGTTHVNIYYDNTLIFSYNTMMAQEIEIPFFIQFQ